MGTNKILFQHTSDDYASICTGKKQYGLCYIALHCALPKKYVMMKHVIHDY